MKNLKEADKQAYLSEEYMIIREYNSKITSATQVTFLLHVIAIVTLFITIFEPAWAGINPGILISLSLIILLLGGTAHSAWVEDLRRERQEYIEALDKEKKVKVVKDYLTDFSEN